MVIINAAVLTPFILFGLDFSSRGWDWVHGAVLAAILAPTDAVSVTAMLKAGACACTRLLACLPACPPACLPACVCVHACFCVHVCEPAAEQGEQN